MFNINARPAHHQIKSSTHTTDYVVHAEKTAWTLYGRYTRVLIDQGEATTFPDAIIAAASAAARNDLQGEPVTC